MRIEQRIAANAAILGTGEAIAQLANLVFTVLLARQFGPGMLGEYSLALAIGAVAAVLVGCGAHGVLTRDIGQEPERGQALVGTWMPAQFLTALAAWTAIALGAMLLPLDGSLRAALLIVGAYSILWRFGHLFTLQFSARGRMAVPAAAEALHRVAILVVGAGAIWLGAPPAAVLATLPAIALIGVLVTARRASSAFGAPPFRVDPAALKLLVARAWPFFLLAVLAVVEVRLGIVLLGAVSGSEEAGVYSAADRFVLPILLVQGLIIRAVYPAMLRLSTTDRAKLHEMASNAVRVMLTIAIPLAALGFVLRDAVLLVFGDSFARSAAILVLLAWLPIPAGLKYLWYAQAVAINAERRATVATAVSIAATAAITVLAAPRYGALGLAVAVLAGQTLQAVLLYSILSKQAMPPPMVRAARAPACAAGLAVAGAYLTQSYGLAVSGAVAAAAAIAGLWMCGSLRRDELRRLSALLAKPKAGAKSGRG